MTRTTLCLATIAVSLGTIAASLALIGTAWAGPNTPGSLVIHSINFAYCSDDFTLCGVYADEPLPDCESVDSNEPTSSVPNVWIVLAAFHPNVDPRLSGVTFGVNYDDSQTFLANTQNCGDFELPTDNWPSPGEGTAVTWNTAQTQSLIPVYGFAGYHYYDTDASFDLTPHPTQGAVFADDSVPADVDDIVALGSLGFNADPGSAPCVVVEDMVGACCYPDGSCEVLPESSCDGDYQGDGTDCDPNPNCGDGPVGACCIGNDCEETTASECDDRGGIYLGDNAPCEPGTCIANPTIDVSWGRVKSTYR